jgi:hypothetical protein
MGPEGFEPSPARLRAGDAALTPQSQIVSSCLCLFQLARRELNPRPASYKDAALTAELRASSWVGGIRTHTRLIKSQGCSLYTTTQKWLGRIGLLRTKIDIGLLLLVRSKLCIVSGSPEN